MFQSRKTAKSLTCHADRKSIDGHMSHPTDSPSWKLVDDKWPEFGEYFTLKGVLLWTINDFSAYGNLCGCVVKGYKACPICGDDTPSHRLKNDHNICYIGHRKWLPTYHPYRRQCTALPEYDT
ncbi:hypothetical protein L3X38_032908 [Prunus dulcis]|uniref:Uncharacterized protein n=1 Tax=Prunus dulcis TaxID=3755 RepID=A0AAD4VEZ1_PRUDU|nr:hypothetical protein L3X38_032908 [Prunus dulcis]